jgi:hypothetical protein
LGERTPHALFEQGPRRNPFLPKGENANAAVRPWSVGVVGPTEFYRERIVSSACGPPTVRAVCKYVWTNVRGVGVNMRFSLLAYIWRFARNPLPVAGSSKTAETAKRCVSARRAVLAGSVSGTTKRSLGQAVACAITC